MPMTEDAALNEDQIAAIVQRAVAEEAMSDKASCVIQEVKETVQGDRDQARSCAIHILNTRLGIGPHQQVLDQIDNAFPRS